MLERELRHNYEVGVVANSSRTFNFITKNLDELTTNFDKFDHAVFVAGSNNCSEDSHVNGSNTDRSVNVSNRMVNYVKISCNDSMEDNHVYIVKEFNTDRSVIIG
ncbi:hypothetical protein J6590_085333 [Homalodisca vitripennis]|nr:hypothetical protein J6590_085333 [Homalodisca vitripennis]